MRDEDESSSDDARSQGASMMEPEHSVSTASIHRHIAIRKPCMYCRGNRDCLEAELASF